MGCSWGKDDTARALNSVSRCRELVERLRHCRGLFDSYFYQRSLFRFRRRSCSFIGFGKHL